MAVILVGLFLSALWGYLLWGYVESQIGFDLLPALLPSELAIVLIAAVTPVALIWLIIAILILARRVHGLQRLLEAAALAPRAGAKGEKAGGERVASLKRTPNLSAAEPAGKAGGEPPARGGK
jgi:hypothetical protein